MPIARPKPSRNVSKPRLKVTPRDESGFRISPAAQLATLLISLGALAVSLLAYRESTTHPRLFISGDIQPRLAPTYLSNVPIQPIEGEWGGYVVPDSEVVGRPIVIRPYTIRIEVSNLGDKVALDVNVTVTTEGYGTDPMITLSPPKPFEWKSDAHWLYVSVPQIEASKSVIIRLQDRYAAPAIWNPDRLAFELEGIRPSIFVHAYSKEGSSYSTFLGLADTPTATPAQP